jgi:hypothetical protein
MALAQDMSWIEQGGNCFRTYALTEIDWCELLR